jgi:glycosyltransferase involved in cell wall biosynthesis
MLRLLYVGRLARGKGLFDLLDVVERIGDVNVRIAGDGPLSDTLETEIADRGLPIELLGYRDDVPDLLSWADLLVLPSYREGTPRVITEALAAGCPVVSTNIAGIPEQVVNGETGYLVPPGDVDGLIDRIEEFTEPSIRREFSKRAENSVEKFSLGRAEQCYRELYRELIAHSELRT